VHGAGQPDGLSGQLASLEIGAGGRAVALVEDQVQHVQYRSQPTGAIRLSRHAERNARGPDALLRAADALGHGRLGNEEGAGDLRSGETTDGPKGQRDLRGGGERRMATQEEEGQGVVVVRRPLVSGPGRDGPPPRRRPCNAVLTASPRLLAAQ